MAHMYIKEHNFLLFGFLTKWVLQFDTWPRLGLRSPGTLGHFRDRQERFCNGIPSEGGIEPSDPIKRDLVRQITCSYFWSAPLGH
jgi:hypothetical protein